MTTRAKYNDKEVVVLYVSTGLEWALVSEDLKDHTRKFKVNVIDLEVDDSDVLIEMSNKNRGY